MQRIAQNFLISDGRYRLSEDGKTTECTIDCKVNLKEIERQYFMFTPNFIKNRISPHIPVVYSVFSFDHRLGVYVCRAKYLLHPFDGTAKVLSIDRDYYRNDDSLPEDRGIVKRRDIMKAKSKFGEYSTYSYVENFSVTARTTCAEDDNFDRQVGENIAYMKATKKALSIIRNLYYEIRRHATDMANDFTLAEYMVSESEDQATSILKMFIDGGDGVQRD